MFADLVLEREPLAWKDLPVTLMSWCQNAGGFAAVFLLIWVVVYLVRRRKGAAPSDAPAWRGQLFVLLLVGSALGYLATGVCLLVTWFSLKDGILPNDPAEWPAAFKASAYTLAVAGGCALVAASLPFLVNLFEERWRRIWALARLSFKEAVRRRVLWVFSALLLVFLFASWFIPYKPDSQLRTYVWVVFMAQTLLLLITAGLLAAFSIPADVKNQTIHTIVTKPVERFEIVLGRFLGYSLLMTMVLFVMSALSLLYVVRGIDPDAKEESMKARVPVFGDLDFEGTGQTRSDTGKGVGVNVGREWDYRTYIAGGVSAQKAKWAFNELPAVASGQNELRCEFTFDIFRTTKGEENKGVTCTFTFQTFNWKPGQENAYNAELRTTSNLNELVKKYGYYQVSSKEITDYHTMFVNVPTGLFENARQGTRPGDKTPLVLVSVRCESPTQYVGMAKHDLYFLEADHGFLLNFFKGTVGLWCTLEIVVGLAVALSTYFNGFISFLTTMFLLVAGYFQEFIGSLATGREAGGGPSESVWRLINKQSIGVPRDAESFNLIDVTDAGFRFVFRRVLDVIPDVERFNLTDYVANGFNISGGTLFLSVLLVFGYLLPWAILAYYLMKWREIAGNT